MDAVLTRDNLGEKTDWILNGPDVWISVGKFSIRIITDGHQVLVEGYERGKEADDSLDSFTISEEQLKL